MNSHQSIFDVPKRVPLSTQAAAAIRKAIEQGAWPEYLPSERRLCELFQVSRPTIRTALQLLAKEGRVEIRHGRLNRVLAGPPRAAAPPERLVGLITHEPVSEMSLNASQLISEIRAHLAEHGFVIEILVCHPGSARSQHRKLEAFMQRNQVFCWILLSVSKELQQWFTEHSVPVLVLGSCHTAVHLTSLDFDYRSVCRHAAGIFLRKGHRRIALVVPDSGLAGDLASEQGFLEGVTQRTSQDDARAIIVHHNGTSQNITAKLDVLFNSAHAPTALLVAYPWHVFAVVIYLLKHSFSVPDKVSLIARDQDRVFEIVNPPISHYRLKGGVFVHRLSRLMLKLVSQDYLAPEPNLIIPKYFEGGTVTQPPA